MPSSPPAPLVGQVLSGKYRIEASVGRGGMGEVFAASHLGTGKRVAVKVVSRAGAGDVAMQRLEREAVAAGRIRSEFVPHVFDVDRTPDGEVFLVMELLRGEALSDRLRARGGTLPWEEVRAIGDDVLSGLIDAHAAGVVHRDLKPGNVFLEQVEGGGASRLRARILDFGVAKMDAPDAEKLTITGEAVGTISYMAPEQIRGASRVDERADVYGFAMMIFEALSGRLPYDARGQVALIASKLERPARSLGELAREAYPPGLEAIVAKALSRKPAERFPSAAVLREAWRALGAPVASLRAAPSTLGAHVPPPSAAGTEDAAVTLVAYSSRASRIGLAVAAAALGGASLVLALALRSAAPARGATTPAPAAVASSAGSAQAASTADAEAAALAEPPPAVSETPAASTAAKPARSQGRAPRRAPPRRDPPPASTAQAPHITTEPRY